MPARREWIYVLPDRNGRPCLIRDFPSWWDRAAFIEKYRDRELDLANPVDWNLAWLLSATEAILWDERCRKDIPGAVPGASQDREAEMCSLADALRQASWVVVESREWESGLD
jgi:hypothetical protein